MTHIYLVVKVTYDCCRFDDPTLAFSTEGSAQAEVDKRNANRDPKYYSYGEWDFHYEVQQLRFKDE